MIVPFLDLVAHHRPYREELIRRFTEIVDSASFVNGPSVRTFEESFAAAHGVSHAIAVANGTVALELALRSLGIGRDGKVIVPANTFIATAAAVANVGARPIFVDCERGTWNISVPRVAEVLAKEAVDAVIAVHLYGQPAPMDDLASLTDAAGIHLIEDAAQAHMAEYRGRSVGGLGSIAGFSFYPGKNLGAIGEGGAVTTDDADLAARCRALRDHGQIEKYHSTVVGTNGRMSEVVGAGLALELGHLGDWTARRRRIAGRYIERLRQVPGVGLPQEPADVKGSFHLFVIHVEERDRIRAELTTAGIGTGLHYPVPIHLQEAFAGHGFGPGSFPNSEWSAAHLLSLPMFPELTDDQVDFVCDQVASTVGSAGS